MTLVSYAQNFEDVMLWRALGHIEHGRYLDIGAQDPVVDSVSKAFYERGWRGWHVEPAGMYAEALRQARPDENVLVAAVGMGGGLLTFHEFPETGLSTLDADIAERHVGEGFTRVERSVAVVPLAAILGQMAGDGPIHWVKIDVEGAEQGVLESWGDCPVRPWVLVIESTLPLSQEQSHQAWEPLVLSRGYQFAYFDGLNRYYVAEQHAVLLSRFDAPPNVFDDFAFSGTASQPFCRYLLDQVRTHADGQAQAEATQAGLQQRLDEQAGVLAQVRGDLDQVEGARALSEAAKVQAEQALLAAHEAMAQMQARAASAERQYEAFLAEVSVRFDAALEQRMAPALESLMHWQAKAHQASEHAAGLQAELDRSLGNAHHWFVEHGRLVARLEGTEAHLSAVLDSNHGWFVKAGALEQQLDQKQHSSSWRLTAPLRASRRGLTRAAKAVLRPPLLFSIRWLRAHPRLWQLASERMKRHAGLFERAKAMAIVHGAVPAPPAGVEPVPAGAWAEAAGGQAPPPAMSAYQHDLFNRLRTK